MKEKGFDVNKLVLVTALFLLSYGIILGISFANPSINAAVQGIPIVNWFLPLPGLESPMYYILPIFGFFAVYFLVDWINDFFKTKQALAWWFPLLFLALAFLAFYIALFWYDANIATLGQRNLIICLGEFGKRTCPTLLDSLNTQGTLNQYYVDNFWERLQGDAYYLFIAGCLAGWLSRKASDKLLGR